MKAHTLFFNAHCKWNELDPTRDKWVVMTFSGYRKRGTLDGENVGDLAAFDTLDEAVAALKQQVALDSTS